MNEDIICKIKEAMPKMTKSHKLIAKYIIDRCEKAAYLTATKLGESTGVSESTVVRFAIELGFSGYPEMQRALQRLIRTNLTSVQRMEAAENIIGSSDVLSKVLGSDMDKIKKTLDSIDRASFDGAVDAFEKAKSVYIIGVRSASILSNYLYYYLKLVYQNVRVVSTSSLSEMFENLVRINSGDVLVAISFPRYSKTSKAAVEFARKRGVKIIALTDSEASPIAEFADFPLYARSDMASFVDSLVAPMSIINALLVAISKKKKKEISDTFKTLEDIWDEFDVYEKPSR